MRKTNLIAIAIVASVLLSAVALSQTAPINNIVSSISQVTATISVEEKDICTTSFYDEVQDVYGSCTYYQNYSFCSNSTGPNTGCSGQQNTWNFECKTGTSATTKNKTECRPNNDFIITIEQGAADLKKQIDYSDWWPCVYSQENIAGNSCLVITCVSLYDGAHNGQFTDCRGGKSCQRFEICDSSIKT